jgi:hypothetical protein
MVRGVFVPRVFSLQRLLSDLCVDVTPRHLYKRPSRGNAGTGQSRQCQAASDRMGILRLHTVHSIDIYRRIVKTL